MKDPNILAPFLDLGSSLGLKVSCCLRSGSEMCVITKCGIRQLILKCHTQDEAVLIDWHDRTPTHEWSNQQQLTCLSLRAL